MLISPLLCLTLALPHQGQAAPPSPFDQVVELEITSEDEALVDAHGPTAVHEYEVEFEGT
ncbi:MAG: hypothetical protein ACI9F9_003308, partial [Candidatus Paceibacteria bacterium]